jgi:transposase
MSKDKEYVGIDISKDYFDVCYADGKHNQFENNKEGFSKFKKSLASNSHCIMEQTGRYHWGIAYYLYEKEIAVSVVNALVVKRFIQMKLRVTKTDKADAKMIQMYAEFDNPRQWEPPKVYINHCRELRNLVTLLLKQNTALKNQLKSLELSDSSTKLASKIIKRQLKTIQKEVKALEDEMQRLIMENEGDLLSLLNTIPGMGRKTAMTLIVTTNGFKDFENARQLSSFLGLSPTIRTSGSSVKGQSRISKMGNKDVRNLLFMCSFTAYKCNPSCAQLFERIVNKRKSKKLALLAVCNKLTRQALAISKSRIPFDENYRSKNPALL